MIILSGIPLLNVLPARIDSGFSIQFCFATIFGCCSTVTEDDQLFTAHRDQWKFSCP